MTQQKILWFPLIFWWWWWLGASCFQLSNFIRKLKAASKVSTWKSSLAKNHHPGEPKKLGQIFDAWEDFIKKTFESGDLGLKNKSLKKTVDIKPWVFELPTLSTRPLGKRFTHVRVFKKELRIKISSPMFNHYPCDWN